MSTRTKLDSGYIDSFTIVIVLVVVVGLLCLGILFMGWWGSPIQPSSSPPTQTITIKPTTPNVTAAITASPVATPNKSVTQQVKNLTITFIDVGQGDEAWVSSPSGKTMLIDAGEEYSLVGVNSRHDVDFVVTTHPHLDHIGGMAKVFTHYTIGRIIDTGYANSTSEVYADMLTTIDEQDIPYTVVRAGDTIDLDPQMQVKVLNPQVQLFPDINDNSIVMLMTYKNISVLFTGDAGRNAESLYAKKLSHVTLLKVAHHGSESSTGPYLISKIHPEVSIISVGADSQYGHPSQDVIDRLTDDGSVVYETDLDGDITFTTNGEEYIIV